MHTSHKIAFLFLASQLNAANISDITDAQLKEFYHSTGIDYVIEKYHGTLDIKETSKNEYDVNVTTSEFNIVYPTVVKEIDGSSTIALNGQPQIHHYALTRLHHCKAK